MAEVARSGLGLPIAVSVALHGSAALALLFARAPKPPAVPPIYQVNIVAAPPGPRAEGVVTPTPPAEVPPDAKVPPRAETNPRDMPLPSPPVARKKPPPPPATPTPAPTTQARPNPQAPAPQAGGGPEGGRGTDVANVRTEGIEFPFPGYLNNIVRQVALRFKPPNPNAPLQAEVMFLIHRDGSVSSMRFLTRSRVYAFDLEAQAAIEAAARDGAFGALPEGFSDDVLPIVFSFDPRLVR